MRPARASVLLVVIFASLECGGSTEPRHQAVPGSLVVRLATPNADDAAIMLVVSGPAVPTSVTPQPGLRLFLNGGLGTTNQLILTGAIANGPLLTLQVPDVSEARNYHATTRSVASTTLVLRAVADYELTVTE